MQTAPAISQPVLRFFRYIARSYFRRHFRAVHIQHAERLTSVQGPIILFGNHCSWWDPMLCILAAHLLLPQRRHYAPIDAEALAQYKILGKVGLFPLDIHSPRGAAQFLRAAEAILAQNGVLWITPQGRFADVREPLAFKAGLAALATRVPGCTLLPLGIEYTFWNERLPETFTRIGEPVTLPAGISTDEATTLLEAALAQTMHELATDVIARDASRFTLLFEGGRGTGGFYALGKWLRALITGRKPVLDHTLREEARVADAREPADKVQR